MEGDMKITAFVAALALMSSAALAQSVPAGGVADDDDDNRYGVALPLLGGAVIVAVLIALGSGNSATSTTPVD
jgi:hypothetical protein